MYVALAAPRGAAKKGAAKKKAVSTTKGIVRDLEGLKVGAWHLDVDIRLTGLALVVSWVSRARHPAESSPKD